jgi:hypothetical protein
MASSKQGRPSVLAEVRDKHAQGNRRAKDDWELYRAHRERLTAAIAQLAADAPLVLLGAGNCNDVDVAALVPRFSAVHLVDIDAGALERARARLPAELRGRVVAHGGVDLTGLLAQLDRDPQAGGEGAIAAGVLAITAAVPVRQAAVVVSCCLLSQLGWSLDPVAGDDPSRGMELRTAALTVHLRTLAALVRPGGVALVAADIVSSDLYPLDELEADVDLAALATQLIVGQDLVFAAANPVLLGRLLRRDPVLKGAFAAPEVLAPWLWTGPFERTYLIYPQVLRAPSKP